MTKLVLNYLTIILFLIILITPFIGGLLGADINPKTQENRNLAALPTIQDSWNYLKRFQSYFNEHSAFRSLMVKADHEFKIYAFNISPNPGVSLGKNDWLFYTPDETLIDTINGHPFSQTELEEISKNLQNTQNYFNSKNIKFYFLIAPNSQTIYAEFLPDHLKKINSKSRLEQITQYLKESSTSVNFINPMGDLKKSKTSFQLYRKFDTHWNDYGAFLTYSTLLTRINRDFPNLKPLSITDFNIQYAPSKYKDLAILLGLEENYTETEPFFSLKNLAPPTLITSACSRPYEHCPEMIYQKQNSTEPKLVMFRDSFGVNLVPFIANHFSKSYFFWKVTPYSLSEIEKEKPDIVIVELTERELWRLTDPLFNL